VNITISIIVGVVSLGFLSQYATNKTTRESETPKYELVEKHAQFEIRRYPQMILATTKMGTGNYSKNSNKGFRTVAGYIFGGNDEGKKISMTAPVMASIEDTMSMSFIMPSEYALKDLPNPENKNVELKIQPERVMAIISFSGFANDEDIKYYSQLLKTYLLNEGFESNGKVYFQGYNPPFQLFNRTNEVAIELANYE
jgi:hypothetical protein